MIPPKPLHDVYLGMETHQETTGAHSKANLLPRIDLTFSTMAFGDGDGSADSIKVGEDPAMAQAKSRS
ncbi:hypothetical protein N7488_010776 [Penicillium malachiteum]|nr:hypothetical protein N7488_010776 [Penicillium malachiteum]